MRRPPRPRRPLSRDRDGRLAGAERRPEPADADRRAGLRQEGGRGLRRGRGALRGVDGGQGGVCDGAGQGGGAGPGQGGPTGPNLHLHFGGNPSKVFFLVPNRRDPQKPTGCGRRRRDGAPAHRPPSPTHPRRGPYGGTRPPFQTRLLRAARPQRRVKPLLPQRRSERHFLLRSRCERGQGISLSFFLLTICNGWKVGSGPKFLVPTVATQLPSIVPPPSQIHTGERQSSMCSVNVQKRRPG